MSPETAYEFGMGMISCAQLVEEGVDVLEDTATAEFNILTNDLSSDLSIPLQHEILSGQLVVGKEGACLTGQRGECPKGHNCGRVIVSMSLSPLFVEITPLEVSDNQVV